MPRRFAHLTARFAMLACAGWIASAIAASVDHQPSRLLTEREKSSIVASDTNPPAFTCYQLTNLLCTSNMANGQLTPCGSGTAPNNCTGDATGSCSASTTTSYECFGNDNGGGLARCPQLQFQAGGASCGTVLNGATCIATTSGCSAAGGTPTNVSCGSANSLPAQRLPPPCRN